MLNCWANRTSGTSALAAGPAARPMASSPKASSPKASSDVAVSFMRRFPPFILKWHNPWRQRDWQAGPVCGYTRR